MDNKTVKVVITADTKKFEQGIAKASGKLKNFGSLVRSSIKAASIFTVALAGATTATFAFAGSVARAGDDFQKMSFRTGISTENLSRLDFAAKRSGTNITVLESALRYLTKAMADTKNGLGEAKRGFDALGISVVDEHGNLKSSVEVLKEVSEKLAGMKNETEKISTAQYIFGARFGTQLLPLLDSGKNGISDLMKKSDELGYTWSTRDANAAATFQDRLTDLQAAVDGFKKSMMVKTFPIWEGAMLGAQAFIQSLYDVNDALNNLQVTTDNMGNGFIDVFENMSNSILHFENFTTRLQARFNIILDEGGKIFAVFSGLKSMLEGKSFAAGFTSAIQEANTYIDINKHAIKISEDTTSKHIEHTKKVFDEARKEYKDSLKALGDYKKGLQGISAQAVNTSNAVANAADKVKTSWHTFNIEGIGSNKLLAYVGSLQTKTILKHVVEVQLKWDGRKIKVDMNNPQLVQEVGRAVLQQIQNGRASAFGVGG